MKHLSLKVLMVLLVLINSLNLSARSNIPPGAAHPQGMGNAFVSQYDISSAFYNQAGLSKLPSLSISASFENRFLLKELSSRSILLAVPASGGVIAASLNAFGPSAWMESSCALSYSRILSQKLSAAIQINFYGTKLPEENRTFISAGEEMGLIYSITPTLFMGIHLSNPFSVTPTLSVHNEKIPWIATIGGHALISEKVTLAAEAEKTEGEYLLLKTGIQWEPINHLYFRGGYNSGPMKLSAGIGFKYRSFTIDFAFRYHQQLGVSPSLSIQFSRK